MATLFLPDPREVIVKPSEKAAAAAGSVKHFNLFPSGDCIGHDNAFQVEAGWGVQGTLTGISRLNVSTKTLKDVKITVELRGNTETRWTTSTNAIRQVWDTAPTVQSRRFITLTDVAEKKSLYPDPKTGQVEIPFSLPLPPTGLPPTFEDHRGNVTYTLKVTVSWSESYKLLKSTRDLSVPVIILMPKLARSRIIDTSTELFHEVGVGGDIMNLRTDKCAYSVRVYRRVAAPGDEVFGEVVVASPPVGQVVTTMEVSLMPYTEFKAGDKPADRKVREQGEPVGFARKMVSANEGSGRVVWPFRFLVDREKTVPNLDSLMITHTHAFNLQIFTSGSTNRDVTLDLPIMVVPRDDSDPPRVNVMDSPGLDVIKGTQKELAAYIEQSSPILRPSTVSDPTTSAYGRSGLPSPLLRPTDAVPRPFSDHPDYNDSTDDTTPALPRHTSEPLRPSLVTSTPRAKPRGYDSGVSLRSIPSVRSHRSTKSGSGMVLASPGGVSSGLASPTASEFVRSPLGGGSESGGSEVEEVVIDDSASEGVQ
ncbi:hypothetical protein HK104_006568, partial [Borealophlyctis nickersoniae]